MRTWAWSNSENEALPRLWIMVSLESRPRNRRTCPRVLYIPIHDSSKFHLLIHDVSAEYKHSISYAPMGGSDIIGDALLRSRLFMTRLGTMKKPAIDTGCNEPQYVIDSNVNINEVSATLRKSQASDEDPSDNVRSLKS